MYIVIATHIVTWFEFTIYVLILGLCEKVIYAIWEDKNGNLCELQLVKNKWNKNGNLCELQ